MNQSPVHHGLTDVDSEDRGPHLDSLDERYTVVLIDFLVSEGFVVDKNKEGLRIYL